MAVKFKLSPPKFWRQKNIISYLLVPFSFLYCFCVWLRRLYYKHLSLEQLPLPIIVVGNVTVGGAGKTPLVIFLAELFKKAGYNPGIISRGYGRKINSKSPQNVTSESKVEEVGDEALLIAQRTKFPVVVAVDRVSAAKKMIADHSCDLIISDDGLQHYALKRDIEVAVVDAWQQYSNDFCLPSGPLREPLSRLKQVDFVVKNFNTNLPMSEECQEYNMVLEPTVFRNLKKPELTKTAEDFRGQIIHAVAGIGNPSKFFQTLRQMGLSIIEHPFPDHYVFQTADFPFAQEIIIMTEKDAVKCIAIATENFWCLETKVKLQNRLSADLLKKVMAIKF